MISSLRTTTCLVALLAAGQALAAKDPAVEKPLNTIIKSIQQQRDELALKQFAVEEQSRRLIGEEAWTKASDAQRKEFMDGFKTLFARLGFPKLRDSLKHLDGVLYPSTTVTGDKAQAESVIVIDHPMKKQELKVKYELRKEAGAWKVVDARVLGDSMIDGIRDGNGLPELVAKKGIEGVLEEVRKQLAATAPKK